jgi:hypothetical protein
MKSKILIIIVAVVVSLLHLFTGVGTIEARCEDARPSDPVLLSAIAGEKSVTLTWSEPPESVSYYLVRYGLDKENMQWGNANIGGRGTTTFTVNELENGTKYSFQVGAVNGCRPGGFSNTMSVRAGVTNTYIRTPKLSIRKNVLGETTIKEIKKIGGAQPPQESIAIPSKQDNCAFTCNSLPILIAEIVALIIFFIAANRNHKIRPIYSVFIPIATIALYYQFHGVCYSYKFFCRYFITLTITSYLLILIFEKFSLLFHHSQVKKIQKH